MSFEEFTEIIKDLSRFFQDRGLNVFEAIKITSIFQDKIMKGIDEVQQENKIEENSRFKNLVKDAFNEESNNNPIC